MRSRISCVLGVLFLVATVNAAHAREIALLVGIADYENITPLRGPRNDITIMWRMLRSAGFKDEDILVLADGVPTTHEYPRVRARPTRAAILDALADVSKRAGKDDFVYVHLSSHGSEQPYIPKSDNSDPATAPQPWDRNQVLLPIDAARSVDGRTIPNGIPDFELGEALDAVRAKAGRVWIVADLCHAGTATRGELVARYVDPADLGLTFPARPLQDSQSGARGGDPASTRVHAFSGGSQPDLAPMVAFFAVSPRDLAFERSFAGYDPPLIGEGERLGVFTYLLHSALRNGNAITYRDLRNEIVHEINSGAAGSGMPLPMFEGDLDAPIFGVKAMNIRKGWPARYHDEALEISAGAIHGLTQGSIVVVQKGASDKAAEVGRAKVEKAQPATSRAKIEAGAGAPALALAQNEQVWVTLAEEAASFLYAINEPRAEDRNAEHADIALAAIAKLKQEKVNKEGIAANWRPANSEDADFRLRIRDGFVWITQATGALNTDFGSPYASPSVRITDAEKTADNLFDALWSLARAQNLVRVASIYPTSGNLVSVTLESFSPGQSRPKEHQDCPGPDFYEDLLQYPGRAIRPGDPRELTHCDMVAVKLKNLRQSFVDAVVVYVNGRGGVRAIPSLSGDGDDCSIVLPPGASDPTVAATRIVLWKGGQPSTAGTEHIIVIAAERPKSAVQTCFRALTQPTLEHAREAETRNAPGTALLALLNAAALANPEIRGEDVITLAEPAKSTMSLFTLNVTPSMEGKP